MNDRLVRKLAGLIALMLLFGAGVVLVRSSRKTPPSVLGVRQTQQPFVVETPTDFPSPSVDPLPTFSPIPTPTPTPTQTQSATPKPAAGCRNSTSPSCGSFSWTRPPGSNGSMVISVEYPTAGFTGQAVTFTVRIQDPDAEPSGVYPRWGDGTGSTPPSCTTSRYGPWDPPARDGGSKTYKLSHTYTKAGTYTVYFIGRSGSCGNPYGNQLQSNSIQITIQPRGSDPSPTPSPSNSPFPA